MLYLLFYLNSDVDSMHRAVRLRR